LFIHSLIHSFIHQLVYYVVRYAVSASDGSLRGFADVVIYVTDVNDNSPTFSQSEYTISVTENAPADVIMTLTAYDDDVGDNALVTYALIG